MEREFLDIVTVLRAICNHTFTHPKTIETYDKIQIVLNDMEKRMVKRIRGEEIPQETPKCNCNNDQFCRECCDSKGVIILLRGNTNFSVE